MWFTPRARFELATNRLTVDRSTTELPRIMMWCFSHLLYNITMFLNLASRFSNFFAINWESAVITSFHPTFMDLVLAVTFCNCVMAIAIFTIAVWTIRIRRQLIGLTHFCDRCLDTWNLFSSNTPASTARIATSRSQFEHLKQIYQQQLITLDRIRTVRSTFKIAKSVFRL